MSSVRWKRLRVWTLFSLAILALAFASQGCRGRGPDFRHMDAGERVERIGEHLEDFFDEIDATGEQRRQIRAQIEPLLEKSRAFAKTRRTLAEAYRAEWEEERMDAKRLTTLIELEAARVTGFVQEATVALANVHAIPDKHTVSDLYTSSGDALPDLCSWQRWRMRL